MGTRFVIMRQEFGHQVVQVLFAADEELNEQHEVRGVQPLQGWRVLRGVYRGRRRGAALGRSGTGYYLRALQAQEEVREA